MRKSIFLVIVIFVVISCSTIYNLDLFKYKTTISVIENTVEYFDNEQIKKCKLDKPQKINGYNCQNWLHFYENGLIDQLQTYEEINNPKYVIPKESFVFLSNKEPQHITLVWFSKDVIYNNKIICNGGFGKISTSFHANGNLKSCYLAKDQNIQGYYCQSSVFKPVIFDENENIIQASLANDTIINGTNFQKGITININNGTISPDNSNGGKMH